MGTEGPSALTYQWQDPADTPVSTEYVGRSIRVDLSNLEPGRYALELRVRDSSGELATARRVIEISTSET
jgi:hypothetical protein